MNKFNYLIIVILFSFSACSEDDKVSSGAYIGNLYTSDSQEIPFNLYVLNDGSVEIYNHKEIVDMKKIVYTKDSFLIKSPVFEGYIKAKKSSVGMEGYFFNNSLDRKIKFKAYPGHERFKLKNSSINYNFSGKWKVVFNPGELGEYNAIGMFDQEGYKISGTFRTTTGDYGFMEGISEENSIKLSTFNGAHSYLFKGQLEENTISGFFYRGNYNKIPFIANRNQNFRLPSPNSLTVINNHYNKFDFSFEDNKGRVVADTDQRFNNKVLVVQIMGTWCPNCLDETTFISEFINENNYKDLEFVSLAFEYAKTKEKAIYNINKLKDRFNIKYPILLAQFGTSNKVEAQKKIPALKQVVSYPTLIFIDKKKNIRSIHTGFNGPATGEKYENFKKEFEELAIKLLNEN
tara:strand:- start:444 stop:1655 length:1212 start_codon:yes stop_codon:yes gene_type:complete